MSVFGIIVPVIRIVNTNRRVRAFFKHFWQPNARLPPTFAYALEINKKHEFLIYRTGIPTGEPKNRGKLTIDTRANYVLLQGTREEKTIIST